MIRLGHDFRYAVRAPPAHPRVHRDCRGDARARDRRHGRDLHGGQRGAPPAAAVSGLGAAGQHLGGSGPGRPVAPGGLAGGLPRLPAAHPGLRRFRRGSRGGDGEAPRQPDGRRRARARPPDAGHRQLLPAVRSDAGAGPQLHRGRGSDQRPARRHAHRRALAPPLRRRSQDRGTHHPGGRRGLRGGGRAAPRLPPAAARGGVRVRGRAISGCRSSSTTASSFPGT